MMSLQERAHPFQTIWYLDVTFLKIVEGDIDKDRNGDRPDYHAVGAELTNDVQALRDQPGDKTNAEDCTALQTEPEPALKLRTSQQTHTNSRNDRKATNT